MYSKKKAIFACLQSQNKILRVNGPLNGAYLEHIVVAGFVLFYVEVGDGELYAAAGSHVYLPHALPLVGVRLWVLRAREHTRLSAQCSAASYSKKSTGISLATNEEKLSRTNYFHGSNV